MNEILNAITPIINKIIIAILILLIGFMAGKLIGLLLKKLFVEIQIDRLFSKIAENFSASTFFSGAISVATYIVSFFLALNHLGVTRTFFLIVISIFFVLALGSLIIWLLEFMPGFYGWFLIKTKNKYFIGDKIKVFSTLGVVTKITILKTWLKTKDGDSMVISNFVASKEARRLKKN